MITQPGPCGPSLIQIVASTDQDRHPKGDHPLDEGHLALGHPVGGVERRVVQEGFPERLRHGHVIPDSDGGQLRRAYAHPPVVGIAGKERVAVHVHAKQVDRVAPPARIGGQRDEAEVSRRLQLHGGATDELLQPLAGRMLVELGGVDLFPPARAGEVAAVDPGTNHGRVPLPVDAFDVGGLRFIPARRGICEGVVDPALADLVHDTMLFQKPVIAEDVDQQAPRLPFP